VNVPLIVGARHNPYTGQLLDRECQSQFTERVFPLIDRNTLLLLEGAYKESYVKTDALFGFFERRMAARYVGVPIGSPTIGWRDGRFLAQPQCQVFEETIAFASHAETQTCPRIVLQENTPKTFAELANAVLCAQLTYHMTGEDDPTQLTACIKMIRSFAQFDRTTIKASREWEKSGRPAIILAGNMHALSIHRRTAWPVISLSPNTSAAIKELTLCFISTVLHPENVCDTYSRSHR